MKENISHTYNIRKTVIYVIVIYLAVVSISLAKVPHLTPIIVFAFVILPLIAILLTSYIQSAVLFYISFIPIIQHLSFTAIVKLGGFVVTPHMMIQLILTFSFVIKAIKDYENKEATGLNLLDKQIIFFGAFSLLSLIFSFGLPIDQEKKWLIFYTGIYESISFYFIILYYLKKFDGFGKQLIIAFLFTSFTSLIVAYSEFSHIGFNLVKIFMARMRFGYGYHNINLYGIQSAILFPVAFYGIVSDEFKKYKPYTYASFSILALLSILCFNRGTFIVMAVQLYLMFFEKSNRKIIYIFLTIAVVCSIYFSDLIIIYFTRFMGGKGATNDNPLLDASAMYRWEAWKLGFSLLWKYPFGVGPGGFQVAWERFGPYPNVFMGTPHHLFLSIGVDYGLLALITFIFVLMSSFFYLSRMSKLHTEDAKLIKFLRISIIGFVVYGVLTDGELSHLTGFTFPNNGYTLIFFTVLALTSNLFNKHKQYGGK